MSNSSIGRKRQNQHLRVALPEVSPEIMRDLIDTQKQKALNEAKEIQLREKELELSARQTERSLDHQALYIKNLPAENRKTLASIGWLVGALILLILGFLTIWLFIGKDQFAYKFLQGAGYFLTTAVGYWAGNREKRRKSTSEEAAGITDAHVLD